jgi:hypothetical protein
MSLYNPNSGATIIVSDNLGAVTTDVVPATPDTQKVGTSTHRFGEINVAYGAFPYLDITSQDGTEYWGSVGLGSSDATVSTTLESYEAIGVGRAYGAGIVSTKQAKLSANGAVVEIGKGTDLTDTLWGGDIPALVIDGTTAAATSAGGAGLVFKGSDNAPFVLATQDRVDGTGTASIYGFTGNSTVIPGRTGDFDFETGATNTVAEQSGNAIVGTGNNPLGTTGLARLKTGNGVDAGGIELLVGTGSATRGQVLLSGAGVQILTEGLKPVASSLYRGSIWITQGGLGVADTVEICRKDAANAYAWVTLI